MMFLVGIFLFSFLFEVILTQRCGALNGNYACDINNPALACCSRYGWCGSTNEHCGFGCQTAFGACYQTNQGTQLSYSGSGYRQPLSPQEISEILDAHNGHRAKHGAAALVWSDTVFNRMNGLWDNNGVFQHRSTGENLYALTGAIPTFRQAIDAFYEEVRYYDYNNPGFSMATGHFTQVVWKGSRYVACQKNYIPGGSWEYIIICHYDPAGNVHGQFPQNV